MPLFGKIKWPYRHVCELRNILHMFWYQLYGRVSSMATCELEILHEGSFNTRAARPSVLDAQSDVSDDELDPPCYFVGRLIGTSSKRELP